ncbi:MAG TPA: T9SS type A sorting domain-containing protein [Draconibacterium sp.]|nr:T9SS type A sorting domain-containing protein [Draconibacterium sp.]
MKKIFTFFIILFFAFSAGAQIDYQTIFDFEDGVDTTIWIPFANGVGTKADLNVVENPLANNVNSSDSVLWMHIYTGAEGWVGFWVDVDTLEIEGLYGTVEISEESHMMCLMVNKPVSNSVRIKLERGLTDPGSFTFTVADTNDVVNEWELLEFDFSEIIGHYMQRVTIFPEPTSKANRTEELDVYIDNVGIQNSENTAVKEFEGVKMKIYPNPAEHRMAVLYPGMTGVRILNINGQEIRTLKFGVANQKVIEVGDLSSGSYFVTAITAKGNFTMPFIKK